MRKLANTLITAIFACTVLFQVSCDTDPGKANGTRLLVAEAGVAVELTDYPVRSTEYQPYIEFGKAHVIRTGEEFRIRPRRFVYL